MEPKIDQKSIIFLVGVPEGPRGRFWKDFGPIWELFWDECLKLFGPAFGHQVLKAALGRIWMTSAQFSPRFDLGWAPESDPRTDFLAVLSALGQKGGQEGSTAKPRGAPSIKSERFCPIFV